MKVQNIREHAFLLVFDRGDEITETLTSFARDRGIAGAFTAIGACSSATIAFWRPETKEYEHIGVGEQVEVVSLTGNIAHGENGQPRVHAHVALGKRDGTLIGGHFISGVVHPTLELVLMSSQVALHRKRDDETGLPMLATSQ